MTLWLTLVLAGPATWQDALSMEKAEDTQEASADHLASFVRANQAASFNEAIDLAIRTNDASGVLRACPADGPDARLLAAQDRVAAALTCSDRSTCTELFRAVQAMRATCMEISAPSTLQS